LILFSENYHNRVSRQQPRQVQPNKKQHESRPKSLAVAAAARQRNPNLQQLRKKKSREGLFRPSRSRGGTDGEGAARAIHYYHQVDIFPQNNNKL